MHSEVNIMIRYEKYGEKLVELKTKTKEISFIKIKHGSNNSITYGEIFYQPLVPT